MGLDALADNIISAESPDEDETLFDANEFLDLNKDIDPQHGFKLPGQAILRQCLLNGLIRALF